MFCLCLILAQRAFTFASVKLKNNSHEYKHHTLKHQFNVYI